MVDTDSLVDPVSEESELENVAAEEKLDTAMEGRGSGIRTESSFILQAEQFQQCNYSHLQ